jgi:diguanylate cyclase (GGDEF)-like protein
VTKAEVTNLEKDEVFEFILKIRESVLKKLDDTKTPTYPKYYEKLFREALIDANNTEVSKLFQRYSESSTKENKDEELERYMGISKKSLDAFSVSNKSISQTVMAQGDYLDSINLNDISKVHVDYQKIMQSMLSFQGQLLDELRRSDEQIRKLETELELALNESKVDPLTKLMNKRAFNADMEQIFMATDERQLNMSILYIDVDDFSNINSEFGHLAGDKVLIFLANTFKNSIRDGDKIYRYGEEQFIMVLNRLVPEKSLEIANRIRSKVEISKLIYSEQILKVTISMGVSHHKASDNSIEDMLARAKEGLKEAKLNGKNLVKERN